MSEEGAECNNKMFRYNRLHHARQSDAEVNLKDVFTRYIFRLFSKKIIFRKLIFNRSYYVGDAKIQRIFGKEALAKRPRKQLHKKVVACLVEPDANLLLPLPPPPSKEKEPEMMDLGLNEE